jgi:hypothetical protein
MLFDRCCYMYIQTGMNHGNVLLGYITLQCGMHSIVNAQSL